MCISTQTEHESQQYTALYYLLLNAITNTLGVLYVNWIYAQHTVLKYLLLQDETKLLSMIQEVRDLLHNVLIKFLFAAQTGSVADP